jgi:hypothetical protein
MEEVCHCPQINILHLQHKNKQTSVKSGELAQTSIKPSSGDNHLPDAPVLPKSPRKRADSSHSQHSESGNREQDVSPKSHADRTKVELIPAKRNQGDHPTSPQKDEDTSRPSASELAKKRAERFGIPVYHDSKQSESAQVIEERPDEAMEVTHKQHDDGKDDTQYNNEGNKNEETSYHDHDELLASGIPAESIITIEDFVIDSANHKRILKVIEVAGGEDKIKEIVANVASRISKEFEGDRSKIRAPPRLATSRLSFALKQALPRPERPEKYDKKKVILGKGDDKSDWKKGRGEWKSNDWNSKSAYHNDKKGKRSYSYDSFESDVEEFIKRNRLDKRSAEAMRTESRGMVSYVMDEGFNLDRYNNPSREVMIRMNEYRRSKRTGGGGRSYPNDKKGSEYNSTARSRSRSYSRGHSRSRSRSRSYSRDRYDRDSRSRSM